MTTNKTAVLMSGHMRTFAQCLPSLHWHVFRRLQEPHFFISCEDDAQAASAYLLEERHKGRVHVEIVKQPTIPEPAAHYTAHAPYAISSKVQAILRKMWNYRRAWEFFQEKTTGGERIDGFTSFLRCRPDLFFHRYDQPHQPMPHEFLGVWKARCGGVNDRFAVMGQEAARAYFTAFDHLQELLDAGCPLHPESLQMAALERGGAIINNLLTCEFTSLRLPGAGPHNGLLEYPGEMADFVRCIGSAATPRVYLQGVTP